MSVCRARTGMPGRPLERRDHRLERVEGSLGHSQRGPATTVLLQLPAVIDPVEEVSAIGRVAAGRVTKA